MKRALLIVNHRQVFTDLKSILPLAGYQAIASTENGLDALRLIHRFEPDLLVMAWDIKGLAAPDLLQTLQNQNLCPVFVIINQEDMNILPDIIKAKPDDVLVHPFRAIDLVTRIFCIEQRFTEKQDQKKKFEQLEHEFKVRKIIHKALLLLIQKNGFDEETAYKTLRQHAMSRRKSVQTMALEIIRGNVFIE
jgi:two-component system, response regulator PdtaR